MIATAPAFAQALNLNPYGLALDPYHVFPPGPAFEPAPTPEKHRWRHGRRLTRHLHRGTR